MTAREEADGTVVLVYDTSAWAKLAAGATLLFVLTAVYDYFFGSTESRLVGLIGSAITMAGIGYVMSERARFRFDAARRRIEWEQGFALRMRRGSIGFDEVRNVTLDRPVGNQSVRSRRIMLHLANGTRVPVTVGYRPDSDRAITLAAEMVRTVLGHTGPGVSDTARLLIEAGKKR